MYLSGYSTDLECDTVDVDPRAAGFAAGRFVEEMP
jgi:hypothetical protein